MLLGQTWSVFADPSSIPNTVDLDGPNSSVSERTIQLRFQPPQAKYNWAAAIEAPDPDISSSDSTQLEPVFRMLPAGSDLNRTGDTFSFPEFSEV